MEINLNFKLKWSKLESDIYTIKLENYKKAQHITVKKNSFIDINLRNEKDVLNEITNICKKAYRCSECSKISLEDDSNDNIALDNGVLLINKLVNNIQENYLVFLRLKNPISFKKSASLKSDLIFTLFSPMNLDTFNRLQILSKLSRMLNKQNIRNKIKGALKAEDVIALFVTT